MLHILYDGRSEDLEFSDLIPEQRREALGLTPNQTDFRSLNQDQIKTALANHFDKAVSEFDELVIEYHKNGNVTVRPDATFAKD